MFSTTTDDLLRKKLPSYPRVVMEKSLLRDIDELVAQVFQPMKLAVVDDVDTSEASGNRVFKALKGRFPCTHVTLEKNPRADDETVQKLRAQTLSADAIIAVGSGIINDLCKYVSHLDRKPYVIFPTAASMNGYLSANASISISGHKKTMLAFMPHAVFCDLSVIAEAPSRMNKSGLGDSLARATAQADWLLSHLLLDTYYDEAPFEMLKGIEEELFSHARGIALGDIESVALLMKVLLLSGLGMTIAGGSYPASQGEHMIAHTLEMASHHARDKAGSLLHGETIGVTTLTMAEMQEKLVTKKPKFRADDFNSEEMILAFGSEAAMQARKAFDGKMALVKHMISDGVKWEGAAEKISAVMMGSNKIKSILEAAQAPYQPKDLGISAKAYSQAVNHARYTRERFTFLDLV